jgi:hypothetical protein
VKIKKDQWQFKMPEYEEILSTTFAPGGVNYVCLALLQVGVGELFEMRRKRAASPVALLNEESSNEVPRGIPTYVAFGPTHGYLYPVPDADGELRITYYGPRLVI